MSSRAPLANFSTLPLDRVTTTFELPGHRVVRNLGVVRGIVVRSRNIVGTFVAGLQTLFGGYITLWTGMGEQAHPEAVELAAQRRRPHRRAGRRRVDHRRRHVAVEAGPPPAPEQHQTGDLRDRDSGSEASDPGRCGGHLPHLAREREGERLEIHRAGEGAGDGEEDRDWPPRARSSAGRGRLSHLVPAGFSVRLRWTKLTK